MVLIIDRRKGRAQAIAAIQRRPRGSDMLE